MQRRFTLTLVLPLLALASGATAQTASISTAAMRGLLPATITVAGKQSAAPEFDENESSGGASQMREVSGDYTFGGGHAPSVTIYIADTGVSGANAVSGAAATAIGHGQANTTTATGYEKTYALGGDFYSETWEAAKGSDPEANLTVIVSGRISVHIDATNATMADAKAILAAIGLPKVKAIIPPKG